MGLTTAWLAWRYSRTGSGFLSFVTLIAAAGLALGTAVLVVVLSVMNGFDRELRERVLGALPHAVLQRAAGIEDWRTLATLAERDARVAAAAPITRGMGLMAAEERVLAVDLTGIDPAAESRVSVLPEAMESGALANLEAGGFGVVLGERLAQQLGVEVGDSVLLVMPDARVTLAGAFPRQKRMRVVGVFALGSELDDRGAFTHLEDAGRLLRQGGSAQGVRLRLHDLFQAPDVVDTLLRLAERPGLSGYDWRQTHGNLYAAIGMQKRIMFVLLSLLVAVAAFNVVSMLTMVVNSRRGAIAILRTMGMTPRALVQLFFLQGLFIALLGIGAGLLLGVAGALALPTLVAQLQEVLGQSLLQEYFVRELPVEVLPSDLASIAVVALGVTLAAIIWPARRALRIAPAEELRHE